MLRVNSFLSALRKTLVLASAEKREKINYFTSKFCSKSTVGENTNLL